MRRRYCGGEHKHCSIQLQHTTACQLSKTVQYSPNDKQQHPTTAKSSKKQGTCLSLHNSKQQVSFSLTALPFSQIHFCLVGIFVIFSQEYLRQKQTLVYYNGTFKSYLCSARIMEHRLSFSYQSVIFVPFIHIAFISLWTMCNEKGSNSALFSDLVHAKF